MMHRSLTVFIQALLTTSVLAQFNVIEDTHDHGHGSFEPTRTECITPTQRSWIQQQIQASREVLVAEGILQTHTHAPTPLFNWPLRAGANLSDPGYHGISNYVDHDPAFPSQLLDYNCGTRSYDISNGYNHSGTDIFTWPWSWYKMDHNQVEVVAASSGIIVFKQDGNYDRNCAMGGGNWNAVYIQHNDGSVAWYGHMKNGSLTPKTVGQSVAQGEYLGVVGSSGSSTGPHLHLEVYNNLNQLIDPWAGSCNPTTPTSWWAAQRPYFDPAVNAIRTQSAVTNWGTCPAQEQFFEQQSFCPNQTIYFHAYYRDQQNGSSSSSSIRRPDNSIFQNWNHSFTVTYAASWWWNSFVLPSNAPVGRWTYEVVYNGTIARQYFYVGTQTPVVSVIGQTTTCDGSSVELRVPRMPGHTYQWRLNGNPIPSANDTILYTTQTGSYTCTATSSCGSITSSSVSVTMYMLQLSPRLALEGPYDMGTGLMSDQLRVGGLIPLTEPYSSMGYTHIFGGGWETTSPAVLSTTGNNAVVDWLVIELRSATDPAVVVSTRSGLLQRDGDVVSVNGTSPLSIPAPCGSYYVAVRHRNHLAVMSQVPIALNNTPTIFDLTLPSTQTYGTDARKSIGSIRALWAGDATFNNQVRYAGSGNDRDPILTTVGGTVPTNTLNGYRNEDINLNGQVRYAGSGNDRDPILINVGGTIPTAVRNAQIP